METNKKVGKKIKLYYSAILLCIILILGSLYIIFRPNDKKETTSRLKIVETNIEDTEKITEDKAREVAKEQFEILGENQIKEEQLKVAKIEKRGEEYFFISSKKNTIEIQIKGGKVTKVNSVAVQK